MKDDASKFLPLLLSGGLLCWGWFVDHFILACLLVGLLLLGQLRRGKWQSQKQDFHPIGDFCGLSLIGFFIYFFLTAETTDILYFSAQMLPVVFFPLVMAQSFAQQQQIPLTALVYRMRQSSEPTAWLDIRVSYLCICLLSAGTAMATHVWYFPMVTLLLGGLLLSYNQYRSRLRFGVWLLMFGAAVGLGYLGQVGLHKAHEVLGKQVGEWMMQWFNPDQADVQGSTAMGNIGQLKLSDRIVLRVQPHQVVQRPLLLQTASFDRYQKTTWFATQGQNHALQDKAGKWQLSQHIQGTLSLEIFQTFGQQKVLLPLPAGTEKISGLYVDTLYINRFKSLSVQEPLGLIHYQVDYDEQQTDIGLPQANDLQVPKPERNAVAEVAKRLQLKQQSPKQVIETLLVFFQTTFQYSTWLQRQHDDVTPLSEFLLYSHQGHCEYFASATVLLLREAGIAARYVVGYSVQEQFNDLLIVRGRDAHAWALAYIDGQWINVDTTPANWFAIENDDFAAWQWFSDWLQNIKFVYEKWQLSDDTEDTRGWLWLLLAVFAIPAWKILVKIRFKAMHTAVQGKQGDTLHPHSPFDLIETYLQQHTPREQGETLLVWVQRQQHPELKQLVLCHYHIRFCANSLSVEEYQAFESKVESWLHAHAQLLKSDMP